MDAVLRTVARPTRRITRAAILTLGLLSVTLLVWVDITQRPRKHVAVVNALLDLLVEEHQAFQHGGSGWLVILVASCSLGGATVAGFWYQERRRRHARGMKDELETRVAQATRELQLVNRELVGELAVHRQAMAALRQSEDQLRELSRRLLTVQDAERTRLATELHDQLGHSLILMKFRVGLLDDEARQDPSTVPEGCQDLLHLIDAIIDDVHRVSRDLRPSVLEDLGLSAALRWLVDNCVGDDCMSVTSSIIEVAGLLSPDAELVVYRIVQEAFTNIAKHARASHVALTVDRDGDRLRCVVKDDGTGFDPDGIARKTSERGLGLTTMRERSRGLGGCLEVWSERGRGTRITLWVPLGDRGSEP